MKILVINAGSSSLKYQLINMADESVILKGVCERITFDGGVLTQKTFDGRELVIKENMPSHPRCLVTTGGFKYAMWHCPGCILRWNNACRCSTAPEFSIVPSSSFPR